MKECLNVLLNKVFKRDLELLYGKDSKIIFNKKLPGLKGLYFMNKNKNIYKGKEINSKKEGIGLILFEDGAKFIGNFSNNKAEGYGCYIEQNKSSFKGNNY